MTPSPSLARGPVGRKAAARRKFESRVAATVRTLDSPFGRAEGRSRNEIHREVRSDGGA